MKFFKQPPPYILTKEFMWVRGPCQRGWARYMNLYAGQPLTLTRSTCREIAASFHHNDIAWMIEQVRKRQCGYSRQWLDFRVAVRYMKVPKKYRGTFIYRSVNKSAWNDILLAFGL